MREDRLFPEGTVPDFCTPEWYAERETAPHIEQPGHRPRIDMAVHLVHSIANGRYDSVVDLGAGDGGLLSLLHPTIQRWGYDLQPSNVAKAAERGEDVRLGDVLDGDIDWAPIAVATEMLEHLVDPHAFVSWIRRNAAALVASSPWTETAESHYEYHAWAFDVEGYAAMIEGAGWTVMRHETVGMFQVVLAL